MKLFPVGETEFQRRWNRNFLTFLPGVLLFGAGAVAESKIIAIAGWVLAALAMFRGWRLIVKYRRCSNCKIVNSTRLNSNDLCRYCGAELPLDGPPD